MDSVLVTGGAGFFGSLLKVALASQFQVVSVDLEPDDEVTGNVLNIRGDIRHRALMEELFSRHQFRHVFHIAAILAHAVKDKRELWSSNVEGTRVVADLSRRFGVENVVFTSSNCLWAENFHRPVLETDEPHPVEIYGRSKVAGEDILLGATGFHSQIIHCPTIIDSGRLGLLGILFEFIDEGRRIPVVGHGDNRYQFIYAGDLIKACQLALGFPGSAVWNIGSAKVKSLRQVYEYVIAQAGTSSRVVSLPEKPTLLAMKLAYALKISPLGPYQYKMIAEDFEFDTTRIRRDLGWAPTLTNEEILWKAYNYYHEHRQEIEQRRDVSAHKQSAKMGVIRLLKWLS